MMKASRIIRKKRCSIVILAALCALALAVLMCGTAAADRVGFTCPADCDCFAVGADSRTYYSEFNKTLQFIKPDKAQFDFMVFPGDMEYVLVNKENYTDVELSGLQTYWCVGNHEMDVGDERNISNLNTTRANVIYYYNDSLNTSYIVEYDKLYLVVLDEYIEASTGNIPAGSGLCNWLDAKLALLDKGKKIFTVGHEPAYPEYAHIGNSLDQYPADRDALWSLFDHHSVEAYFCGHTHYYSRNSSMLNVTQVDVGNMRWWGDGNSTIAYVAVNDTNAMVYIYSNATKGEVLDLIASYDVTNNYGADSRLLYHADNAANDVADKNWGTPRNGVDTQANTGVANLGREGHFVAANDEYVEVPTDDSLNFGTGNFSISLWFNTSGTGAFIQKAYDAYSSTGGPGWALFIWDAARLEFTLSDTPGGTFTTVRTPTGTYYNDSQWHHVVISVGRGTNQVGWYVDGVHIENDDLSSRSGSVSCDYDLWIGANYNKGAAIDREFNGDMNEVAIYDRTLDATEVSTLYNSGNGYQHTGSEAGLVSAWHMNEDTWVVLDSSGNGNNGTLTGTCYGEGVHNAGFKLDGTADYVFIPHDNSLDLTGKEMALEAWVKWGMNPGSGNAWAAIINKYGDNEWRLQHNMRNTHFEFAVGSSSVVSTSTIQEDVWYHVVGTYNSTHLLIYVNGTLENTASYSSAIPVSSSDVYIGRRTVGDRHFNGTIDEVAIYNRSLSAAEVLAHYNEFTPTGNGITCTCGDICVNETGWWRGGGTFNSSVNPLLAAHSNATDGDTICVKDGTYNTSLWIYKDNLTFRSENGTANCIVNATGDYAFATDKNYVNISGFTVENATATPWWSAGIIIQGSNCNVSYNLARGNFFGINIDGGDYNLVAHNNASYNSQDGIRPANAANNNEITGNTANYNTNGIYLYSGCNNSEIMDNTANYNSQKGIALDTNCNYNTLTGNNAFYNTENGFHLELNSQHNTLKSNIAEHNNFSIYLYNSCCYNNLTDNIARFSSWRGIVLHNSCNYNNLTNNTASNNVHDGVHFQNSCNYNNLTNNTANSNGVDGIDIEDSNNNTLLNNTASNNTKDGIILYQSNNNTIRKNTVLENHQHGIQLENGSNNNVSCNWVQNSDDHGFHVGGSSTGNTFKYNNIVTNGIFIETNGSYQWQFYNGLAEGINANYNYWGPNMTSEKINASIYGEVTYYPFNMSACPCAPIPEASTFFLVAIGLCILVVVRYFYGRKGKKARK